MSFLSDALDFEKLNLKEMWGAIEDDPERLFLGALTPVGSEVWGGITGKDYESPVNMYGGPSDATWAKAEEEGIDTGAARGFHDVAESVAASYASGYGLDQLGSFGDFAGKAGNVSSAPGGMDGGGGSGPPLSDDEERNLRTDLQREMYRGSSNRFALPLMASVNTGTTMANQQLARPPEIEELMQKYGRPTGAQTYPEGALPGAGLDVQTVQSPALASGNEGQASNAPAMAQPTGPQAGAGTSAQDTIMKARPGVQVDTAEQSANAVSSKSGAFSKAEQPQVMAQKQQVNETLQAQGVAPKDAFESLYQKELETLDQRYESGEITKREHKGWKNRWKNIYNTVPEEDMGLFLMDFGLRMMAHSSESDSLLGSAGMAGQGALQGAMQRKDQRQQMGMQRDQQAFNRALSRANLERRPRDSQIESTQQGLIERTPEGEWRPIVNPETGKPYQRSYAGNKAYQGEKFYMAERLRQQGVPDDEINSVLLGARTPEERSQLLQVTLGKLKEEYTAKDSRGKYYRNYGPEDEARWIAEMMGAADKAVGIYQRGRRGGALQ